MHSAEIAVTDVILIPSQFTNPQCKPPALSSLLRLLEEQEERPAADGPIESGLGKVRHDAIRRGFIGTLAVRVQVWVRRHAHALDETLTLIATSAYTLQ